MMRPDQRRFGGIRHYLLIVLISFVLINTLVNLFCLYYTFNFLDELSDGIELEHPLPFLQFEIGMVVLIELFTIYSASRIYYKSDPDAFRTNLIKLVSIWTFLILFMCIVVIQFYLSSGEISGLLLDEYFRGLYDYDTNSNAAKFVDRVSRRFACCGIENSTDWEYNKPYGIENHIPESCCKRGHARCNRTDPDQINNYGCAKNIIEWPTNSIYTFMVLWFNLIGLSFAFCFLLKKIRDEANADATGPNDNSNKHTKYSQIRYSKVKQDDPEAEVGLMAGHQEDMHRDSYDEDRIDDDSTDSTSIYGFQHLKLSKFKHSA